MTLLYFRATPQNDNAILLEWETATELDTVAFNLYRSQDPASLGQLLAVRPAQGDGLTGAAYSLSRWERPARRALLLHAAANNHVGRADHDRHGQRGDRVVEADTHAHTHTDDPAGAYAEADTYPRLGKRNGVGAERSPTPDERNMTPPGRSFILLTSWSAMIHGD